MGECEKGRAEPVTSFCPSVLPKSTLVFTRDKVSCRESATCVTGKLRGPAEEEAATAPQQKDPESPWKLKPQRASLARAGATEEIWMLPETPPEVQREEERSPGCSLPLTLQAETVPPVGRTQPEGIDQSQDRQLRESAGFPTPGRARD